ncbi:MAG TPA: CvpA family protein [Verrucomicrobiae bacterium]
MIAAAVQKTTPWWQNLSFNWFDITLLCILAFGFWRGRKRGMSREALPTIMWLVMIIGGGYGYEPLGDLLRKTSVIRQICGNNFNERTFAYMTAYILIGMFLFMVHAYLAKVFRERVSGSNTFGNNEYYLGIGAGMVRYACITIFFLALLNAPFYSSAEIAAQKAYNNRWYGGGEKNFSGNFIPSIADIQIGIFQKSMSGRFLKEQAPTLLVGGTSQQLKAADGKHR